MSQIETAVTLSRNLETLLAEKFHATGKGLHEKLSSVEVTLPPDLVKQIRFIATMRNSVVHETDFQIPDLPGFVAIAESAAQQLTALPAAAGSLAKPTAATDVSWKRQLSLAFVALGILAGGAIGVNAGGLGLGIGCALGGGFLTILAITDEAIAFYKGVLETILGLFVIGAIITVVVAACGGFSGSKKPVPNSQAKSLASPHTAPAAGHGHHSTHDKAD